MTPLLRELSLSSRSRKCVADSKNKDLIIPSISLLVCPGGENTK
jgi:hypothetical protein